MNTDQIEGTGKDAGGTIKEAVGNITGDTATQHAGIADQITGTVQKTFGNAKDAVTQNAAPLSDTVRKFTKERPFAAAALIGVVGLALLNTLRGKTSA